MKQQKLLALVILVVLANNSLAELRCGNSLVSEGDWPAEVEQRCGTPDYIANYPTATVPGLGVVGTEEHWYYNPGPQRFVKRLVFKNGTLAQVESMGYGFHVSRRRSCDPGALRHTSNEYELVARCGQPASKRVEWQVPSTRKFSETWTTVQPVLIQEWLYDFPNNQLRQLVTLMNGRVVKVSSRP